MEKSEILMKSANRHVMKDTPEYDLFASHCLSLALELNPSLASEIKETRHAYKLSTGKMTLYKTLTTAKKARVISNPISPSNARRIVSDLELGFSEKYVERWFANSTRKNTLGKPNTSGYSTKTQRTRKAKYSF